MHPTAKYCPTRRGLEQQGSILVERLSSISTRLMCLAAADHKGFNAASAECAELKTEIAVTRYALNSHRKKHGC